MRKFYVPAFTNTTKKSDFRSFRLFISALIFFFSGINSINAQSCPENNIGFNGDVGNNSLTICEGTTGNGINGGDPASGTSAFLWEVSTVDPVNGPFTTVTPDPGSVANWSISSDYYNAPGTYYFRRTTSATGTSCDEVSDVITLIVTALPATPGGSTTQIFCTINNPTVADLVATGAGTIQWYANATGGPALNASTALVDGTHYFASQTVSTCESAVRLDVTVTVSNPAIPGGSNNQTFCAIANPTVADLVATGSGTIQWYTVSTGGTPLATSTALVNGTHYYASQTTAGCEGTVRLDVTATVSDPATPGGNLTQTFCAINNPTIADLIATGNGIQWYSVLTGGTPLATSTVLVNGTHYYASQTASGCESTTRLDVTVTVSDPAVPTGTSTQPFCSINSQTVADLTATGTNLLWYAAATGGSALAGSTPLVSGTHYFASQTVAGCESTGRFDVTVTVGNPGAPTGTSPQAFCVSSSHTVADLTATGTTIQWYTAATGGTVLATSTTLVNGNHYFASQTVAGCESATRLDVTVSINALPVVSAPSTLCVDATATLSPTTGGTWVSSNNSFATVTNAGVITGVAAGSVTFTFTDGTTGCSNTTSSVTVNSLPVVSNGSSVCIGPPPVNITPNSGGTWISNDASIATITNGGAVTGVAAGSVNFTFTQTSTGCSKTTTNFTVNPNATANVPPNQTLCNGTNTANVNFTGPISGTVYNWTNTVTSIGLAASGASDIGAFAAVNTGTVPVTATINVIPEASGCNGTPFSFTYTVNPTPTVTNPGNQTLCNSASSAAINFSGTVTGTAFNWTNSVTSIGLGGSGSGNITSFTATNPGTTTVTSTINVTPSANSCPGTVVPFTITVNPLVTVSAITNQTVCNGTSTSTVNFTSTATGGTIVYNWTNDNTSIGLAASGSGNINAFTATNAGTTAITATITVTPSYTNGVTCPGTPRTFTITVNPTATVNTISNQTVCNGGSTTAIPFSTPNTGGTIVYNWTNDNASIGLAASGSGNSIPSFISTNTGTAPVTATITVTPSYTNGATTCAGTPRTFTITVNPAVTATAVTNQTVCAGVSTAAITLSSPATGGTIVYNWTNNNTSIGLGGSGSGNIPSFTAANGGSAPITATITVTPSYTNGVTCAGTPMTFTITVNPAATVTLISNQAVCNAGSTTIVNFTSPTTGGTIVYNWTNDNTSIGLAASGTGNAINAFTATNAGTAPVTATITVTPSYTNGATTCPGSPRTFTITVNPTPNVAAVTNQTLCKGAPTTAVTFSGTVGSTVYNWTNSNTAIGLGASGSGNIASFTAANPGTTPITATITVTPSANSCPGTPITFTITVNPTATIATPGNQNICNGSSTTLVTFGAPVSWTNNATSIGLAASGPGDIASFTGANSTNAPVTATISVTPTANGCNGSPVPFTITVNPTTTVNAVSNQALCNGTNTTLIAFTSPVAGTTFDWTNSATSIGLAASGTSANIAAFTATNLTGVPVIATITVTPKANTCTGTPITFTITVNPTATVTNPGNQSVCKGASVAINFTGIAGATFNWTNNNTAIGLGAAGAGNLSFTAANDTSIAKVAQIAVSPVANGCTGATINFNITVNPAVAIIGNTMSAQACSKTSFSITPADSTNGVVPAGTTYTWTSPSLPGGLTGGAAGSGTSITGTLTNSTTGGLTATYTVTPTTAGCVGTPFTLLVTIYPYPIKQMVDFFQTNVYSQQLCIGALVGGGNQNDLDVHLFAPPTYNDVQPPNNYYDNNNFDWDWEYATGNSAGPTVPFVSSPGTTTTHYQQVLPPAPSVFSPIGDYWFRFYIAQNGCATYSDTIHLQVTSTLVSNAGGPYVRCSGGGSFPLTGSSVTGTSSAAITGQWSIFSGGGTLSNTAAIPAGTTAGNANLSAVTYTPATGFVGTAKLVLKSNAPGSGCQAAADTAYVIVLPGGVTGTLQGCRAPANWTLTNTNGNGQLDPASQLPCAANLIGSNNNSGNPGTTDYKICSGAGNFKFDWVFTAPTTPGATPVWRSADQTINSGAGTNRGSFVANRPTNLVAGDLIIVILHARDNVGSVASPDGFSSIRKDVSGNNGTDNRGTVLTYWKLATASEPATYSFQANSMGTNDTWVAVAGRVTGADPNNPIDGSNGANSGGSNVTTITAPGFTTTGNNRLMISSVSIIDDDHIPNNITEPGGLTQITEGNSSLGDDITYGDYFYNFPTAGATGNVGPFTWTASDAAAAQLFAIKPAGVPDDSAYVIVNGVQTLISGVDGTTGSFTIPVNTNDQVGFRISTKANNGGAGMLTFYSVSVPNDTPKVVGTAAITIPACNPATPSSFFVTPTATDNCGITPTISAGYPTDGTVNTVNCTNTQTRTWVFEDNCGLKSTPFVQTITWTSDATPPSLTCPPAKSFCLAAGNNYTIDTLVYSDGCSPSLTITYAITGATSRTGTGKDASGLFNLGVSTITWTVKDACNNTSTCSTTITIVAVPTATMSGTTQICNGGNATISVALTGATPYSITYTDGGTPVTVTNILSSTYTFVVSPTTTTTWSLTAMSSNTCSGGTVSGNAAITVRPLPTATISGSTTICAGTSTNISISPTGTAPWSITYTDGVTPVTVTGINSSPYTFSVSPAATTTYSITAMGDANCAGTSFAGTAVVTINQKPNILVTPSAPSVCIGGSGTTLTASGGSTYSWSPSTGLSATTGATVTANPTTTTTYTVTGTDGNGCVNTKTVTVTVSTPPVTTGANICQGGTGTISSSACAVGTFTVGPNNPQRGVDSTGAGTGTWLNPGNITSAGPVATQTIPNLGATHYIKGSNYGFAIPAGATITGITVTVNRRVTTAPATVRDNNVKLVKAGVIVGTNFGGGTGQTWPTVSFATTTYGTVTPLWGTTWTPADINDPNFGAVLSALHSSGARTLEFDYMQITVNYTLPGSLSWYTVSSGGISIGSVSPFNPVGVAGSGLANTNTTGTTVYYAECAAAPGCRTATNFVINPLPTITTTAATADVCFSNTAQTTTLGYGATTNTPTSYTISWNAAALAAGLANVATTTLPASPITIPVAGGVVAGTYTGTISVSNGGGCVSTGNTFTLTINPVANLALTSAAGTNNQQACLNASINPVTYNVTGATNASASGLPAGVSGIFNAGVFTISGTPTADGLFNYTITTSGGCGVATAIGSINVQSQVITLTSGAGSSTPTICENSALATNIVYTISGTATSATVSGLPSGMSGTLVGNVFTISGTPSGVSGSFPYIVTTSGTCGASTANGTVTVLPAAVGGTLASALVCNAGSGVLTLSGQVGTITRWESSTDGGTTWTNIANTTTSQSYTGITQATQYRVLVNSPGCTSTYSSVAILNIYNLWTGGTSIDWNTASNWSGGVLPSTTCDDVVIPAGTPFSPTLSTGTATIYNLVIKPSAALIVTNAKLQIAGAITNGGSFDVTGGTLEFNGTSPKTPGAQNINGSWFVSNTVKNLTVSNTQGLVIAAGAANTLNIAGDLAFGNVNNANVTTNNNIVLASTASATARVADITNNGVNSGNRFSGNVTVQRFYPATRAWRLITSPLSGTGTIFQTWQNNGVYEVGKGALVTYSTVNATNGMDPSYQMNSSLRAGNNLTEVPNTKTMNLSNNTGNADNLGYFMFVRGDRNPINTVIPNTNITTLSSSGKLQTGTQTFPALNTKDAFTLIGNPYASPVDFNKLTMVNIAKRFWVWDPQLNIVGGYVVMEDADNNGTYTPTPASGQNNHIQSSQAFFVQTAANGTASITFNEPNKSAVNNLTLFRPISHKKDIRINLYKVNEDNSKLLADGNYVAFDDNYSKTFTNEDAIKFYNLNETFGVFSDNKLLAIEKRPSAHVNDTIFLRLTKTTQRKYRFELAANRMDEDNLAGFVEDKFLHKLTPLTMNGATTVDFEITSEAGSAAADRFMIVFKNSVTYTDLQADVMNNDISVRWNVANEYNIKEYVVERSTNGTNFTDVATKASPGNSSVPVSYDWVDVAPTPGFYYYRIRSTSLNDVTGYSNTVKVKINKTSPAMYVVPNPVTENILHLQMNNMPAGVYHVRLMNSLGQSVVTNMISHAPGTATESIKPKYHLVSGIYQLEVISPDKKIKMIKVIVK